MAKAKSVQWTRDHFLIALNLYCKLPFGKLHKANPIIIQTAEKMGRSPGSHGLSEAYLVGRTITREPNRSGYTIAAKPPGDGDLPTAVTARWNVLPVR